MTNKCRRVRSAKRSCSVANRTHDDNFEAHAANHIRPLSSFHGLTERM